MRLLLSYQAIIFDKLVINMHDKKKYNNKTSYSIQGLRPVSKALPRGLKTILKKGGSQLFINNQ